MSNSIKSINDVKTLYEEIMNTDPDKQEKF